MLFFVKVNLIVINNNKNSGSKSSLQLRCFSNALFPNKLTFCDFYKTIASFPIVLPVIDSKTVIVLPKY